MSLIFSLNNISKSYGDDTLFTDLSIDFKAKEQLGLIGMNGSGKSTLLKIIAGMVNPDDGEIVSKSGLRLTYLSQEDQFDDNISVEQVLFNALTQLNIDEYEQHGIVQKSLGLAGFKDEKQNISTLSGGWKKKLSITRALACQPDVLLLDEPTNHLDIQGILWLETLLKQANFSFILVSHDRAFLDHVCLNIMEIGKYYPSGYFKIQGQYQHFYRERQKFLSAQQKQQSSLSSKMRREDEWLSQGAKARTTKAKYRIDQAYKLRMELYSLKDRNRSTAMLDIDFYTTGRRTKKLLQAFNLKQSMNESILFSDITFELGPGNCLGVVGENGSGKSTFLSILEKKTIPDEGKIDWAPDLKISVFDQNRSTLNPEVTLKDALNPAGGDSVNYKNRSIHIVSWAKRFLFLPDQLDMPVKRLSGGEKARIMLANIMLNPSDILLLDEPTNDLDILSLEVLEDSLKKFPGAIIIVSHDRYLLDKVCHKLLYFQSGQPSQFFTDFNQIIKHRKTINAVPKKPKKLVEKKKKKSIKFSYKDKYELDHIEEKILTAESEVETLSQNIQDPEIIANSEKMNHYCNKLTETETLVSSLYERWEVLETKKEGLS